MLVEKTKPTFIERLALNVMGMFSFFRKILILLKIGIAL